PHLPSSSLPFSDHFSSSLLFFVSIESPASSPPPELFNGLNSINSPGRPYSSLQDIDRPIHSGQSRPDEEEELLGAEEVFFHPEVCQVGEEAEGKVLHHEALRDHADMLARLRGFLILPGPVYPTFESI
ncbi:hypothetical protein CRG98_050166, partial [Punica granatum]